MPTITANAIGELRRSTAASTFGPGAVADFRTSKGAPVSVVMAGLDEWVRSYANRAEDLVHDARLERALGVDGFRLPPVVRDREDTRRLPAVRFPRWLQCPQCHVIAPISSWASDTGDASRWCAACSGGGGRANRVHAVPVRFIMACPNGHLDDFPWNAWAEHAPQCEDKAVLMLVSRSAGLSGLVVRCRSCGKSRSMEAAFDRNVIERLFSCTGNRPWLAGDREQCSEKPRVIQRGASNLYFPVVRSSLLIPPWDAEIEQRLGDHWPDVIESDPGTRRAFVLRLLERGRIDIPPDWDADEFASLVVERVRMREGIDTTDLRREEWQQLAFAHLGQAPSSRDFEVHPERVPQRLRDRISHVVRVVRLRELRALRGFTRINPPPEESSGSPTGMAPLALKQYPWLPAVEVRGEGIFLALSEDQVAAWESRPDVAERAHRINSARRQEHRIRHGDTMAAPPDLSPRHLLAHVLAHALMRQLALECGYSTASLRERIYAGEGRCGVLIYTATTDADGTLGGLERQGEAGRIARTLRDAIASQRWCSSDPLCIRGAMMTSNASNLAACHACMLAPETSCEHFNQFLDRALLVGTPENSGIGFFADWL